MENRLKERLTGAAILVALIVMLVPEMFRGQGGEVSTTTGSSGDGPPVRSYTIDLSNNPKHNGPLQSTATEPTAAATPQPSAEPPRTEQSRVETAKPEASKVESDNAQSVKPETPPQTVHAARVANAATTPGTAKPAGATSWSVQVGLFSKRENAERMMHEAQGKGFNVAISSADSKGMFHVRATGLADRAAAQALSQKMKASGLPAAVVAP